MIKDEIRPLIERHVSHDGLTETGVAGVKLFRATQAVPCAPAVYEPSVIAIASGAKEAVLNGQRFFYDSSQYLLCPMSMPVNAGTPAAAPDNPLFGVYIALDPRMMSTLAIEMENAGGAVSAAARGPESQAIRLARWDPAFSDALLRLLQVLDDPTDMAVLGQARLRELYFAILKGDAGRFARQSFGAGNAIARSIAHLTSNLNETISIDSLAARAGMSRAVFHRKFKQATTMSPIQFVKTLRLNNAAMRIAGGTSVNEAAIDVGYVSPSQFSREFKRMYGQPPSKWSDAHQASAGVA